MTPWAGMERGDPGGGNCSDIRRSWLGRSGGNGDGERWVETFRKETRHGDLAVDWMQGETVERFNNMAKWRLHFLSEV